MLIIPGDIVDGVLVNAVGALMGMVVRPHASRRTARELDIAGWADTEALIKDGLPDVTLELPELSGQDERWIEEALRADETQAALQALLAARLTDAPALGFAALTCIFAELGHLVFPPGPRPPVNLQVPRQFRKLFRDWTEGRVDFTETGRDG